MARVDCSPVRLAPPERRVGRERQQHRQLDQHPLHHLQRSLRRRHRHVHVHAEHQLTAGDVLEHLDQHPVAVAGGDLLVLVEREGMRGGGAQAHVVVAGEPGRVAPDRAQIVVGLADRLAHDGARLEHALHQLRLQLLGERPLGRRSPAAARRPTPGRSWCGSTSMYSSSTPTVSGGPSPKRWSSTLDRVPPFPWSATGRFYPISAIAGTRGPGSGLAGDQDRPSQQRAFVLQVGRQ